MTNAQAEALQQMWDTAEDLDGWRLRAQQIEEPEPGSELAIDDEIFEHMATSQIARMSLALAGEHLRLALDAINARQLYPSSHFTVLRGALVGSSQGVWMLAPDSRDLRRERGLTVIAEMYTQLGKYYTFLGSTPLTADDQTRLEDQRAWLRGRQATVKALRSTTPALNLTEVIAAAADSAFSDQSQRFAARGLWRQLSSDAHVLGWSLIQRSEFGPADPRTGVGEGRAPGSPERIAEAFLAGYQMLKYGWSLFDRRCEAP